MRAVSAVVVAFGDVPLLPRCVDRLLRSEGVDVDVVVVDNGASPAVLAEAASAGDGVRVVDAGGNRGFGAGCNLGARHAQGGILAFVNPDALVAPRALAELSAALDDPSVGIATALVRLHDRPELVNSAGGAVHFLGLGWADGFGSPAAEVGGRRDVAAASGAAMAVRRKDFEGLGGFTEELFLYHEDAELSLRCWMAGMRVLFVPDADVEHSYSFSRNPDKLYHLERNRLVLLLTCFERRTLILLAPAAIAFEVGMVAVAVAQGWAVAKLEGWWWLVRHRHWLSARRRAVQTVRCRPDRELAPLLAARFRAGQMPVPGVVRAGDRLLAGYWWLARRAL